MTAAQAMGGGLPDVAFPAVRRRASFSPFDPRTPHLRFAVVSILLLWLVVLTGIQILPKRYVSNATLIVPGASTAVNVALDKIGQASSAPVSTYNTTSLSPKVIYKEIIASLETRTDAARALGLEPGRFPAPRIKLIDETPLILLELSARDPADATRQADALITAFQRRLDVLRADELDKRSSTVRDNMAAYEASVSAARERIARLQSETGLQSATQFAELSAGLIRQRQKLADLEADLMKTERAHTVLADRVGVDAATAARAVQVIADPGISRAIADMAEVRVAYETERRRLGGENPALIQTRKRLDALSATIDAAMERQNLRDPRRVDLLLTLHNNTHQAELFKSLVASEAHLAGRRAEVASLQVDVGRLQSEHTRLGRAASELEDLKKSQTLAEAVFTTAMARINTSKSDIYGSYPLVQILAAPSMPRAPGGTQGLFAIAGGVLGTLLLALAWFLAWLRTASAPRTPKSA